MQLYAGSSDQFIRDTVRNQIAGKFKATFFGHFLRSRMEVVGSGDGGGEIHASHREL